MIDSAPATHPNRFFPTLSPDTGTPLWALRYRSYSPIIGRFVSLDPYEGDVAKPLTLHKYAYAHNDSVNNVDPTGKFSLSTSIVVGASIGGVLGGIGGVAYSTVYRDASLFSWDTAQAALIGAMGGAAAGALLGGAVFATTGGSAAQILSVLQKGTQQYFAKWKPPFCTWNHPRTLAASGVGFGSGLVVGWQHPNLYVGVGGAAATASTFLLDISMRGVFWKRDVLFPNLDPVGFANASLYYLNKYVLGSTFLAIGFGVGFTAEYTIGASARGIYEEFTK